MADRLRILYLGLLHAWNERDAEAMAACFTDGGIMIGFDGSLAEGGPAIRDHLAPIFRDHPTAAFLTVLRARRATSRGGILLADVAMVPPGGDQLIPATLARQTLVAEECDGDIRVALFQNTPTDLDWDDEGRKALLGELGRAFKDRGLLPEA
ncbi:SgcJ/EcaC family oxidoreductase [Tomitella fengzijianii]|uniref:SgcJ/EcaC family oxidoreductase n=1 Tax=Tomitella fengzijianii TaxID=2597660 RepID=UPI00131BB926|nr:SgcJ/EcaC family oxidoreductase [Tomitella fengzijianii]